MATGSELGDYLRSRRERIRPEDIGLPGGDRRRVAGLRREEVALLLLGPDTSASVNMVRMLMDGTGPEPRVCTSRSSTYATPPTSTYGR
ncbi:hypothetical protein [Streptomyces umbrinus]